MRVLVEGAGADAARWGALLGAPVGSSAAELVFSRPELVVAVGGIGFLRRAAVVATLAGAGAVLAAPVGSAVALPWWGRRFHRFLFRSQADARRWADAGIPLGRLVVVEPGEETAERAALAAVVEETLSMARRPAAGRSAR